MDIDDLEIMKCDSDWTVRYEVALRAEPALLAEMLSDSDEELRGVVQQRSIARLIEEQKLYHEFTVGFSL
jgi:hypothetical protein